MKVGCMRQLTALSVVATTMSTACSSTLRFIEDYRMHQVLWDPKHKDYNNNIGRVAALRDLSSKHLMDVAAVKGKIKSIRSYFSREHQKVLNRQRKFGQNIKSSWYAYDAMAFIIDCLEIKEPKEEAAIQAGAEMHDERLWDASSSGVLEEMRDIKRPKFCQILASSVREDELLTSAKVEELSGNDKEEETCNAVNCNSSTNKDELVLFGELVATKLCKLSKRNQALAQNYIYNYLFQLEIEEMDNNLGH